MSKLWKEIETRVQISSGVGHDGRRDEDVRFLHIVDAESSLPILRCVLSHEEFGKLTASHSVAVKGVIFHSPHHGKVEIVEQRTVPIPEGMSVARTSDWTAWMDLLELEFLEDGWTLDKDKTRNPHHASKNSDGPGDTYLVTIRRWVEQEGE